MNSGANELINSGYCHAALQPHKPHDVRKPPTSLVGLRPARNRAKRVERLYLNWPGETPCMVAGTVVVGGFERVGINRNKMNQLRIRSCYPSVVVRAGKFQRSLWFV